MRSNSRHLYADIFWYGVLAGSALAFIAIYATRLGATSFQISLLTAGPAVINLLFSLPAGNWLQGRALAPAATWSAFLQRAGYLVLIPLPWFLGADMQIWAVVGIALLTSIPGTLLAIAFNALIAEIVPAEQRGEVIGKRNALLAVSMTGTTLLCGQLLDRIVFPLNYQIVFGLGVFGAMLSTYHIWRLRQDRKEPPQADAWAESKEEVMPPLRMPENHGWLRTDLLRGSFGPFILAYLLFYTFQYFHIPLFPLTYVNLLHLTDGEISLGSGLFYGVMLLVSLRLSRLSVRFGHRTLLYSSAILLGIYPLLLAIAQDAALYWLASLLGGGIYAVLSASLLNRLIEVVPASERPAYMALHNLALNLGILAGSLAGPLFTNWLGLREALLIGAGFRLLAGILLVIWG